MTKLRNTLIVLSLVVMFLTGGAGAFAQTVDTIVLNGTVPSVATVSIAAQAGFDALDLATTTGDQNVAIVTLTVTGAAGYTLTATTANGTNTGLLIGTATPGNTLAYTLKYGPTGTEGAVTVAGGAMALDSTTASTGGENRNILISWTGATLAPDSYTDTLTLTIAAN